MFYTLSDKKTTSFEYILLNLKSSGWPVQVAPVQDTNQSVKEKKLQSEWGHSFVLWIFMPKIISDLDTNLWNGLLVKVS